MELYSIEVDRLARKANELYENKQYDEAIKIWKEALELIPEPKESYYETRRILLAIGDTYFLQQKYPEAFEYYYKIHGDKSIESVNFYILLRLGECYFELGEEENAKKFLYKAYTIGGIDIFELEEGPDGGWKYYAFLKAHFENLE